MSMNLFDSIFIENTGTGIVLSDIFSTVQPFDPDRFKPGTILNAALKNKDLGVVEVVSVRSFFYKDIRDSLAYLVVGKPAAYLAQILTNKYAEPNKKLDELKMFYHIVLKYKSRNLEVHQSIWEDFWNERTNKLSA